MEREGALGVRSAGERNDLEGTLEAPGVGGPIMPEAARAAKVEGSRGAEKTLDQILLGREESESCEAEVGSLEFGWGEGLCSE